jgi:hypothetical protein
MQPPQGDLDALRKVTAQSGRSVSDLARDAIQKVVLTSCVLWARFSASSRPLWNNGLIVDNRAWIALALSKDLYAPIE